MTSVNPCADSNSLSNTIDTDTCSVTVVGQLPIFETIYNESATADGVYTNYFIEIDYVTEQHVVQMAPASSTVLTASFAYLASPTMKKIVSWSAEQIGDWPAVPNPVSTDANLVLMENRITGQNVEAGADGSDVIYTLMGEYIYGVINPATVSYIVGVPPYLTVDIEDATFDSSIYENGIVDAL